MVWPNRVVEYLPIPQCIINTLPVQLRQAKVIELPQTSVMRAPHTHSVSMIARRKQNKLPIDKRQASAAARVFTTGKSQPLFEVLPCPEYYFAIVIWVRPICSLGYVARDSVTIGLLSR